MKMVKSLLLGSAAGLVAVAGAQAADLPVKAKPVEYVKVCTLYGAGFYYVPGTDMCLKVGGWVRSEWAFNYGNSMTTGAFANPAGYNTRTSNNFTEIRTRGYITADARQQTEWGTLRSYIALGVNYDSPSGSVFNGNRAFIQWAGFTFGTAQSFYDFYSAPAVAYLAAYPSSDTGDPGWKVAAYTAQLGNGFSASLSLEEPRRSVVVDADVRSHAVISTNGVATAVRTSTPFSTLGVLPTADQIGINWPDVVGNIRVDQAWGSAQIMGAIHDASGGYYTSAGGSLTGATVNGHPGDEIGWAIGAGLRLKTDFISKGDYFQAQFNYTEGAIRYAAFTPAGAYSPYFFSGNELAYGWFSDGVFAGNLNPQTGVQLTTAWNVNASYEHIWSPQWRTSLYGGYLKVEYNNVANAAICSTQAQFLAAGQVSGGGFSNMSNCNNDFGWWWIGSRTQWNPTPNFYMGVDVIYQKLETASAGTAVYTAPGGTPQPSGTINITDQDNVSVRFRVHRDFLP